MAVDFRTGLAEKSVVEVFIKDYMCVTKYAKFGKALGVKERPRPWRNCLAYNRKRNARNQPVPEGEYRPESPGLLGICRATKLNGEAAQTAVGFTLARNVREEEEIDDLFQVRPKCLVLVVESDNPLRLRCVVYNKEYEDGPANSIDLCASEAFAIYGFGLDRFGNIQRNV